ncbi:MAG: hypothetical protein ACPGYX_05150 [Oceanobacter sp.]
MATSYSKSKGRKAGKPFLSIPHDVADSEEFISLSGSGLKLLLALVRQYRGKNNGDLSLAFTLMKDRGFKSKDTLQKAKQELLDKGFIVRTREGRFLNPGGVCDLFALTWLPIHHCNGKLDVPATDRPSKCFIPSRR